ncbi:circularly permuted type 2 ATP-grasp protein [Halothermothrix orenii]|uniref:circularly permuted type 2 ATP-grasp protein n=1 Tax=Halothermothrix orenii TaxID=31909 RepID=UPI00031CA32D|nr:circularly permuted type 2 ATP-grasp protein [Halothermothrix orenii]
MQALDLFNKYKKIITSNSKEYYRDFLRAKKKVEKSTAWYHGQPVDFLYQPMFLTEDDVSRLNYLTSTLTRILNKVIFHYKNDPVFRKQFGFPPLMEEMIMIDPGYKIPFPVARFDIFYRYDGGHSKFCELNADGSSAMNEAQVIQKIIKESRGFSYFKKSYEIEDYELFYSLIDSILDNFKEYCKDTNKHPNVAIVDFEGEGTINEFLEFKKRFIKLGYKTIICDPRQLEYRDGALYFGNFKVDLIYRRATTGRLIEEADDIQPLLQAYRDRNVCIVGGLVSQVIHNKVIFSILHNKSLVDFLKDDELNFIQKHIPFTRKVNKQDNKLVKEIINNRDKYVLKPFDLAASRGVYVGRDFSREEWEELVNNIEDDYLVQEFIDIPRIEMLTIDKDNIYFENYGYLIGCFLYNQNLSGFYTRAGRKNIIGSIVESFTVPNFVVR